MSYLCISHAVKDQAYAEKLSRELTKYGFSHECIHERTPKDKREKIYGGSALLLLITSPVAEESETCVTDLRRAAGSGKPCVCISLMENALDRRFCSSDHAIPLIPYPAGEIDVPDERATALFVHRLYIRCLIPLGDAFSPDKCTDDEYGRVIVAARKAMAGDSAAQYTLGHAYEMGQGLPVSETEAAYWIASAAENGHTDALIRLGELRLDGKGIECDPAEALRLFSKAARAGDARGQFAKGICCLYGYGMMKDPEMALRYFRAAAAEGYIPALYRLGLLFRDGLGVEANFRLAVKYLYMAATGRDKELPYLYGAALMPSKINNGQKQKKYTCVTMRFMRQRKLDRMLRMRSMTTEIQGDILPSLSKEEEYKLKFCKKSCKSYRSEYPENAWIDKVVPVYSGMQAKDYSHQKWDPAPAESALGQLLEEGSAEDGIRPSPRAALMWYRRAAMNGHLGAIFRLGNAYRSGKGIPKDTVQSVRLFHRAALLGSRRGQFAMGVCCERGEGTPVDLKAAVKWYEEAAKAGYAPAQNNLGGCYERGIGVQEDLLAAVEWYTRAGAEGEPNAMCRLGHCYEMGRGVTQSFERAFRLYETAAKQKHPYATYRLALFYDRGISVPTQVAYAVHLYERAAQSGVGDAAYAMALCVGQGRGVRKNADASVAWLKIADKLGSIQGSFALGMAYYEGRIAIINPRAAKEAFERSEALYRSMPRRMIADADHLYPIDGLSATEAAGRALYMLGYLCSCDAGEKNFNRALSYFVQSANIGNQEAMTAIGDLYSHGLVTTGDASEDEERITKTYQAAVNKRQPEAILSLAERYTVLAERAIREGKEQEAASLREQAVSCLALGMERGIPLSFAGMAGCHWFGYGTPKNRQAAYDCLKHFTLRKSEDVRLVSMTNTLGALWLGDLWWSVIERSKNEEDKRKCIKKAYWAYVSAIDAPLAHESGTPYMLHARLEAYRKQEEKAKAEAHYRIYVLSMMYLSGIVSEEVILKNLGIAILSGHTAALDDLTRLFLYEKHMKAQADKNQPEKKKLFSVKKPVSAVDTSFKDFGKLYYGVLMPKPDPFTLEIPKATHEAANNLPEPLSLSLTDTLRAEALNRLGDRYFYGQGIPEDKNAAVCCYRRAAETKQPRGEKTSGGIVWAQYSLGYCTLHGIGTVKDPREAVRWLTTAAKYHGEASLSLARCHLEGIGVDRIDRAAALKYYRRALKFGCKAAVGMIEALEAEIGEES